MCGCTEFYIEVWGGENEFERKAWRHEGALIWNGGLKPCTGCQNCTEAYVGGMESRRAVSYQLYHNQMDRERQAEQSGIYIEAPS